MREVESRRDTNKMLLNDFSFLSFGAIRAQLGVELEVRAVEMA